jgi:dTDP-glucose pyrophosphorylase
MAPEGVIMRGIILAGGKGTQLFPLTKVTNKHLLPVGLEPMLFHPVRQMVEAGLRDLLVMTSNEQMGEVVQLLGSGKVFQFDLLDGGWTDAGKFERLMEANSMMFACGSRLQGGRS